MQHLLPAGMRVDVAAFSILGRIGGDATLMAEAAAAQGKVAFSILGRIGGDATGAERAAGRER